MHLFIVKENALHKTHIRNNYSTYYNIIKMQYITVL